MGSNTLGDYRQELLDILQWSTTDTDAYSNLELEFFVGNKIAVQAFDKRYLKDSSGGGPGPGGLTIIDNGDDTFTVTGFGTQAIIDDGDETFTVVPAGNTIITDNGDHTYGVTG